MPKSIRFCSCAEIFQWQTPEESRLAHEDAGANPRIGDEVADVGQGETARQPELVRVAFADGVENLLALLSQKGGPSDPADAAQARARILDVLSHAVGAIVMSRACPDDSPLADEILTVCRRAILRSQRPPGTEKAKARRRKAG